jgi:signal transduction histidine kinase
MASSILGDDIGATRPAPPGLRPPPPGLRPRPPGLRLGAAGRALARLVQAPPRRVPIQLKLVIAFLLVSLVPMMIAALLTARVVSHVFERNIETWLTETSSFLLNEIVSSQREAAGLARFVVEHTSMASQLEAGARELPPPVAALLDVLGYDLVTVYSPERGILYATQPIKHLTRLPLGIESRLYQVEFEDRTAVMVGGVASFTVDDTPWFLVVGNWLDDKFVSNLAVMRSLEARLYYRQGGDFTEIYSAQGAAPSNPALPRSVSDRLEAGPAILYEPAALGGAYRGIYRAVPDGDRQPAAIIFCGLRADRTVVGWLTETNLFLIIFVIGLALSVAAGVLMARRLTRPLRALAGGVQAIAAGDYDQRVIVLGDDEVADLATAFNRMTARLADLHMLEAQLRRRDRLSALGEVAVGIAHEVRNPLGVISTSAELVRKKGALAPADAKLLGYVIDEVRRINNLITEFLSFAKPTPPLLVPLKAIDVVKRVAEFCEPELGRQNVELAIIDDAPGAMVEGDQDQLYQAGLNLILNALDAMPDGGRLAIRLYRVEGQLRISFVDSGPGVPAELQERIFNPFFTTKPSGTGLGLAKSFSILESHGGRIEYADTPAGGAMFTLVLPLYRNGA